LRKLLIADAGPLIAFTRLRQLDLLTQLFASVLVTDEVFNECTCRRDFAESATITEAVSRFVLRRCSTPPTHFELALPVDAGEANAIAAAVELGCGVLMDDKADRRMAKQKELLLAVKPSLEQLSKTGYFLGDPLIASALLAVGEG
jgi:predicted nucleic acid-binding protein